MKPLRHCRWILAVAVAALSASNALADTGDGDLAMAAPPAPRFRVDPDWHPQLPEGWILGQVAGVAVDDRDHLWVLHRPNTLDDHETGALATPPRSLCCRPAPPVLEFDADGRYLQGWGGPQAIPPPDGHRRWPESEHGIFVDRDRNVWIAGNGETDSAVLKFSSQGRLLLEIGRQGKTGDDRDWRLLGGPADIWVDPQGTRVYIADGYRNHRIIVFDATTGAFVGLWGADGRPPGEAATRLAFGNPVHCVAGTADGLIHVCDRMHNRLQLFRHGARGVEFIASLPIAANTRGNGSAWDVAFSPDQTRLYVADGENERVWVIDRRTGRIAGWFGGGGHLAGQFNFLHNLAVDSRGAIYTAEVGQGRRVQKFIPIP